MPTYDSGYTVREITSLLDELVDGATESALGPDAGLIIALEIGLLEGVVDASGDGTLQLSWPRSTIEERIAELRAALARGMSLRDAIATLPPLPVS